MSHRFHNAQYEALPRQIWMYWDQGEAAAPFLVRKGIDSWRSRNPGWEVRVLDGSFLANNHELQWLRQKDGMALQQRSDWLRVYLLHEHGGVWADATLYCNRPLNTWLPDYYSDHFFAFSSNKPDRVMTNWFLAGTRDSQLLQGWHNTMMTFWQEHEFRQPGYWSRQLLRKLTSLRRRNLVSNNLWFSRFLLDRVKVYPYPINMYLFEKMLDDDTQLTAVWQQRQHLADTQPEHLQNTLGMNAPATPDSIAFLRDDTTPVHKLNWRQDKGQALPGSNLAILLQQAQAAELADHG